MELFWSIFLAKASKFFWRSWIVFSCSFTCFSSEIIYCFCSLSCLRLFAFVAMVGGLFTFDWVGKVDIVDSRLDDCWTFCGFVDCCTKFWCWELCVSDTVLLCRSGSVLHTVLTIEVDFVWAEQDGCLTRVWSWVSQLLWGSTDWTWQTGCFARVSSWDTLPLGLCVWHRGCFSSVDEESELPNCNCFWIGFLRFWWFLFCYVQGIVRA